MGRIKKLASQKHEATVVSLACYPAYSEFAFDYMADFSFLPTQSPFLADFVGRATSISLPELPSLLRTFPRIWHFPRGDLYHWINVLNRFDEVLAAVIETYSLNAGPQTKPFGRDFLLSSFASEAEDANAKLNVLGYGDEGDRELVESILDFSRLLMEKCGNRSLYSSSERLSDLLNTTSLSLLQSTLRLSLALAQRYYSRQRGSGHLQQSLLATHYNIDLEKLQKIASPFPRPSNSGKEKEKPARTKFNANDLPSLTRENDGWEEWGHVRILYYPSGATEKPRVPQVSRGEGNSQAPSTPTPLRRSSTHPTPRLGRMSSTDDSPSAANNTPAKPEEVSRGGKFLDISYASISSSTAESLLAWNLPEVPAESKYELLHRLRSAKGLITSHTTREQVLSLKILAIANLAYIYPESMLQQRLLQHDAEQPKRLQIAYQLAELVHLGASGDLDVSRTAQTLTIQALDALAKHKTRAIDVCAALNINANHGILMFLTRKSVDELGSQNDDQDDPAQEEWRDALLALLRTLPGSSARTPETLVAAGLIPMFVDILNFRTDKARRVYSRIMEFLDTFVHTVRDTFTTLTNAKGFDAVSDLIETETKSAYDCVQRGAGIPSNYKTPAIDYQIPYFQQQTLRWLFRFVNHLMQHTGGGFDRVLRNLIDSPQLLTSLRLIFENAGVFGSHVWSGAVNILSSFIHNEPTSYAVIAEAGLSKSFLQAVMASELKVPEKLPAEADTAEEGAESTSARSAIGPGAPAPNSQESREYSIVRQANERLAPGILPAAEAISCIPSAFGAICLNASGLQLFQSSHALESFFEIFENPDHVKCLKDDPNVVRSLGAAFDELARHHPALKPSIMSSVIVMVARVGLLCKRKAWEHGMGTKLWTEDSDGKLNVSGGHAALSKEVGAPLDSHSSDAPRFGIPELNSSALPNGGKLVVGDLSQITAPSDEPLEVKDIDSHGLTVTDYMYSAVRFLGAFFENQANCTYFIESGGVEFVLDFATLQSLPFDFHNTDANQELIVLVHMLAETKPHLVIPSLVNRAQVVVDSISGFWAEPNDSGFFTTLIKQANGKEPESVNSDLAEANGTFFAKNMAATLIFVDLLREVYSMPLYQTRPSQQMSPFLQVNLAERYSRLIATLGNLHAACVWEEILLEKNIPDSWNKATKVHVAGFGPEGSNEVPGFLNVEETANLEVPGTEPRHDGQAPGESADNAANQESRNNATNVPRNGAAFKNAQTLRFLMSTLPSSITGFSHNLGLGLIGKKKMDPYQRQNAYKVADSIAEAVLKEIQYRPPHASDSPKWRSAYLIVILSSFSNMLFEGEFS